MPYIKFSGTADVIYLIRFSGIITHIEPGHLTGSTELPRPVMAIMIATDERVESNIPVLQSSIIPGHMAHNEWLKTKEILEALAQMEPGVYSIEDLSLDKSTTVEETVVAAQKEGYCLDWLIDKPRHPYTSEVSPALDDYLMYNIASMQLENSIFEQQKNMSRLSALEALYKATEAMKAHLEYVDEDDPMRAAMIHTLAANQQLIDNLPQYKLKDEYVFRTPNFDIKDN